MTQQVNTLSLSPAEISAINSLLDNIFMGHDFLETEPFLLEAHLFADELPRRLRQFFYEFKLRETSIGVCVKNNPLDGVHMVCTPDHIPSCEEKKYATRDEVLHILYSSLLGEVFTWSTIQNGN